MDLPDPPPGHPYELARRDGYAFGSYRGATFGVVTVERLGLDRLGDVVEEARAFMRERDKQWIAWLVPEAAEPGEIASRLREFGMPPCEEPPMEARHAALAITASPAPGPSFVEARMAASLEEFRSARHVSDDAFEMSKDDRAATAAAEESMWELECSDQPVLKTFVALVDGAVVGSAAVIFGGHAGYLVGGSTRADMRGRGIYRALVRARWQEAVDRGTPALTVSAGRMSRPILERLGFQIIGWEDVLLDRLDA